MGGATAEDDDAAMPGPKGRSAETGGGIGTAVAAAALSAEPVAEATRRGEEACVATDLHVGASNASLRADEPILPPGASKDTDESAPPAVSSIAHASPAVVSTTSAPLS
jgi:hypothetical protein